jgi:hypothetical protein
MEVDPSSRAHGITVLSSLRCHLHGPARSCWPLQRHTTARRLVCAPPVLPHAREACCSPQPAVCRTQSLSNLNLSKLGNHFDRWANGKPRKIVTRNLRKLVKRSRGHSHSKMRNSHPKITLIFRSKKITLLAHEAMSVVAHWRLLLYWHPLPILLHPTSCLTRLFSSAALVTARHCQRGRRLPTTVCVLLCRPCYGSPLPEGTPVAHDSLCWWTTSNRFPLPSKASLNGVYQSFMGINYADVALYL